MERSRFSPETAVEMLRRTYGEVRLAEAQKRLCAAAEGFYHAFGSEPEAFFSAPGRTELGGNHTDHQHGCVLAASVDLDLIAAAAPTTAGCSASVRKVTRPSPSRLMIFR